MKKEVRKQVILVLSFLLIMLPFAYAPAWVSRVLSTGATRTTDVNCNVDGWAQPDSVGLLVYGNNVTIRDLTIRNCCHPIYVGITANDAKYMSSGNWVPGKNNVQNTLINNVRIIDQHSSCTSSRDIEDSTGASYRNYIRYSNSNGKIDLKGNPVAGKGVTICESTDIMLGNNVIINHNSITVTDTCWVADIRNSNARIELYGLTDITNPKVLRGGVECNTASSGAKCNNIVKQSGTDTVYFEVDKIGAGAWGSQTYTVVNGCTDLTPIFAGNVGDNNPWHAEYSLKNSDDSSISSYTSSACCDDTNSCVWAATCYAQSDTRLTGYTNNENILCADPNAANPGASWIDCDGDTAYHCGRVENTCGYGWDADLISGETVSHGGYSSGSTDGLECCGDDSNENIESRLAWKGTPTATAYHVVWADDSSDAACCNSASDCVMEGICYTAGTNAEHPSALTDSKVRCNSAGSKWLDVDYGITGCTSAGFNWVKSGDGAIGEYGSATNGGDGITECCGDDANENYNIEETYSRSIAFDNDEAACCDSSSDCIAGGTCYTSKLAGTTYEGLNLGSDDDTSHCYNHAGTGKWIDCDQGDFMDYWCGNVCGPAKGVISPRTFSANSDWNAVYAGESGVGEYSDTSTLECCGDDANEFYISTGPGPARCCNNPTDCVDSSGECKPSGTCTEKCWTPVSTAIPMPTTLYYGDEDVNLFSDYDNRDGKVGDPLCLVNVTSVNFFEIN